MKEEKQRKGEEERMKSIMKKQKTGNKPSNSKYKCSVWGKRLNKKSRTIK